MSNYTVMLTFREHNSFIFIYQVEAQTVMGATAVAVERANHRNPTDAVVIEGHHIDLAVGLNVLGNDSE